MATLSPEILSPLGEDQLISLFRLDNVIGQ